MATTKKETASKEKELRDELQQLLNGSVKTTEPFESSRGELIPDDYHEPMTVDRASQQANVSHIDVNDLDIKIKKQARGIIDSMYDFYYTAGVLDKPDYIDKKKNIDSMGVSNMLFVIKSTKHMIKRVLEEVNLGNMNPKLLENYCALNAQMIELIKTQANQMLFLEESVKKSKIETNEYNQSRLGEHKDKMAIEKPIEDIDVETEDTKQAPTEKEDKESKYFITSDPTVLIGEIENTKITYDEVKKLRPQYLQERGDVSKLVDYSNKNDLVEQYDVDITTIKEDTETGDDSDILDMI